MQLRPYQQELIDMIRSELRLGKKSVCAVLGCGGGKSVIQGSIAKMSTDKGNEVLFLVHRKELCQQIANTFFKCGVDLDKCKIEMVQTVSRRIDDYEGNPKLIITDECHHALSKSYTKIYEKFRGVTKLGFTATPYRMGKGGLGEIFDSIVEGVSTKWLIDNHYLSPYTYYGAKIVDTNGLRTRAGEYIASDVAELMEKNYIYGETYDTWAKLAYGKRTIIYCASIEASKSAVKEFNKKGISASHLDGQTPGLMRMQTIKDFRDGKITVLSNVELFGEGFDVPDCECVVLLRPTMSLTLHIQQSMRSMRYKENKTAVIIDHVGNVYRHGLPDDNREWTLESDKKKHKETEIKIKQCPVCFACLPNKIKKCSKCGHVFEEDKKTEREDAEVVDVELREISSEDLIAELPYNTYKEIDNFDEMERFRKAKKYKFGWTIRKCIELGIQIPAKYNGYMRRMGIYARA